MIEVRKPLISEVAEQKIGITALLNNVMQSSFHDMNIEGINETARSTYDNLLRFCKDGSAIVFCAYSGECIVGLLWAYERTFMGRRSFHVSEFVVDSSCRRQGVGRKLMEQLEKEATARGIASLELLVSCDSEAAVDFYKTQGFAIKRYAVEKTLEAQNDN